MDSETLSTIFDLCSGSDSVGHPYNTTISLLSANSPLQSTYFRSYLKDRENFLENPFEVSTSREKPFEVSNLKEANPNSLNYGNFRKGISKGWETLKWQYLGFWAHLSVTEEKMNLQNIMASLVDTTWRHHLQQKQHFPKLLIWIISNYTIFLIRWQFQKHLISLRNTQIYLWIPNRWHFNTLFEPLWTPSQPNLGLKMQESLREYLDSKLMITGNFLIGH